ncbi:WD40-repeat-containing domain protein [Apiospora arundinis]
MLFAEPPATHFDTSQTSDSTFLSASMDGTLRIWDRRVPNPIARIGNRPGVPPWCMGACWSNDGNWIYVGHRNGTVEEFSVAKARGGRLGWQPERVFRFPGGSGPVSCLRPMANGRHLICASHDILRLYDLRSQDASTRRAPPPFLIVPGPPSGGCHFESLHRPDEPLHALGCRHARLGGHEYGGADWIRDQRSCGDMRGEKTFQCLYIDASKEARRVEA